MKALIHAESAKIGHLERHKSIKLSTYGIVFMGTPHQGTDITLGNLILGIASVVIKTNPNLVENLKRDSELLGDQSRSYLGISDDFATIYCYETKPIPPFREPVGFFCPSAYIVRADMLKVVPYASTVVKGVRNAPAIGIQKDHKQMVKFSSNNTKDYQDVSLSVKQMVAEASDKVRTNWAEWDMLKGEYALRCNHRF